MVWKRLIAFVLFFIVSLGCALDTQAYSIYPDGTISSTMVNYFDGVLNNYPNKDYIIWRDSQYIYYCAVGPIDFNNSVYTSSDCDLYSINTYQQYNSTYVLNHSHITNFSLNNSSRYIVYSSLGDMPNIQERGSTYEYQIVFLLFIFALYFLVWSVLKFGSR